MESLATMKSEQAAPSSPAIGGKSGGVQKNDGKHGVFRYVDKNGFKFKAVVVGLEELRIFY